MAKEDDEFLIAEQKVNDLVETLSKLKDEAGSYQTAKNALETVRVTLMGLIISVQAVAKDSQEVVRILKGIGGPQIFSSIEKVSKKLDELNQDYSDRLQFLKVFMVLTFFISILSLVGTVILVLR